MGDTRGSQAKGVYTLRHTVTGKIYNVGKADTTGLVSRLESYAADWVARNIEVQAKVYPLPGDFATAEKVLRWAVRKTTGESVLLSAGQTGLPIQSCRQVVAGGPSE